MPDETVEGQSGEEASTEQPSFDPDSQEIEVSGRKMTVANLAKSYGESEKSLRTIQQESHGYKTKSESYTWADDLQARYTNDPAFRRAIDEAVEGSGGNVQQINPQYQEMQTLKQDVELFKMEQQFDKIRSDGYELTKEMEQKILHEVAVNPAIQDTKAAFWSLFGEEVVAKARSEATAQTANQMTDNQASYTQKPAGSSKSAPPPSITDMTPKEKDAELLRRISEMDLYK